MKKPVNLLFLICFPLFLLSQGSLTGIVHCFSGTPIQGTVIQLGPYSDTTNFEGMFSIGNIPSGPYILEVSIQGYPALPTQGIQIVDGEITEADIPVPCDEIRVYPANQEKK